MWAFADDERDGRLFGPCADGDRRAGTGKSRERGTALLVALLTVLVVTMSLLVAASLVQGRSGAFRFEERRFLTTALADAALAEALARLDEDDGFTGVEERPLGDGTISIAVESTGLNQRKVVAVGRVAEYETSIVADVEFHFAHPRVQRWRYRSGAGP